MADAGVSSGQEEGAEDDAAMDAEGEQWLTKAIEPEAAEDSEEQDAEGPSKALHAAPGERPGEAQATGRGQLVAWEEPRTAQPSLVPPLLPLVASPSNPVPLSPLSPAESTLPPAPRPPPAALHPASPEAGVPRSLSPLRGAGPLVVAEAAGVDVPVPPAPAATEEQKAQEEARAGTRGGLKWKLEQARMVFKLGIPVDVARLGRALPSSELVGKGFLLRVRKQRPPTWNAIVSCAGTVRFSTKLTVEAGRTAAKRFARLVRKRYSASAGFKHFRFMFAQVGARLGFAVNVERMSQSLPAGCRLVDLSPTHAAVQVPTSERKLTVYVWNTGKIKTYASETVEEALAAMEILVPVARQHCMWW